MQAFGVAGMAPDDWRALLASYEDGAEDAAAATRGYVFKALGQTTKGDA
jgi:hypothetical protein